MTEPLSIVTGESEPSLFLLPLSFPSVCTAENFFSESCSAARRKRSGRYHSKEDRIRSLAAGWLVNHSARCLTGRSDIHESHDNNGRPWLPETPDKSLSISHSGSWVACAFYSGPVGIDIEETPEIQPGMDKVFMSRDELQEYGKLRDSGQRRDYFHRCWCLKECWLKAEGTGMLRNPTDARIIPGISSMSVGYGGSVQSWRTLEQTLEDGSLLAVCWR